jgi:hypothetical protein
MTFARSVRLFSAFVLALGIFAWRPVVSAQVYGQANASYDADWVSIPAYVSAVSGAAQLERAGEVIRDFEQVPLEVGDYLSPTRGRVEILFSDGTTVALDEYSAVSVDAAQAWRLHGGRIKAVLRGGVFDVDGAPAGVARLRSAGDYLVTLTDNRRGEAELELAVARGSAELENRLGRSLVRAGTRALTTASYAPSVPYAYNPARDAFERWTESLEADRYGVASARYLPVTLSAYGGDFDRYGSWSRYGSYGWVWYPRVSVGWQPYRSGRWTFIANFGYSWIGGARWEWPTHHYGRWDRAGARWFWVPHVPVQTRRVGYAVPRRSFNTTVAYYSRPVNARPVQTGPRGVGGNQPRPAANPSRPIPGQQQRAVPRAVPRGGTRDASNVQVVRPAPQSTRPTAPQTRQTPTPSRSSTPAARPAQLPRPGAVERTPSRQAPSGQQARPSQPQRSAPSSQAEPPPPRTGSRTPSSGSRTPSVGRGSSQSSGRSGGAGVAVPRRGGRG